MAPRAPDVRTPRVGWSTRGRSAVSLGVRGMAVGRECPTSKARRNEAQSSAWVNRVPTDGGACAQTVPVPSSHSSEATPPAQPSGPAERRDRGRPGQRGVRPLAVLLSFQGR